MDQYLKRTRISLFGYKQFYTILKQSQQDEDEAEDDSKQELLNQFQCMIVRHKNKKIECICVNQECRAQNRRMCVDCILQRLHDQDNIKQQQQNQMLNADELNNLIKSYQSFLALSIDQLQYCFYFEQLKLTNEQDEKKAYVKMLKLQKINSQIKEVSKISQKIDLDGYILQQHNTNMGLFEYFIQFQQEIIDINQNLEKYISLRSNDKYVQDNQYNGQEFDEFQELKKKKHIIIKKLTETQYYKDQEIDSHDNQFIQQQINELNQQDNTIQKEQQQEYDIKYYQMKIKNNQYNYQALLQIGNSLYGLKRFEEAIKVFNKAIQLNSHYQDAYNNKAITLNDLKRYEEAIKAFDKAIQLNPNYQDAYYNKGICLFDQKRYEEAIKMYDMVIKLNPQYQDAYYNKGITLSELKRYDEAMKMYDQTIQLNPQYIDAYNSKGISLNKVKQYEEAIMMYERAIELNPQYSDSYLNKGISLCELKRYEEAIFIYDKAIKLNPQFSDFYYNKGISLTNLKRNKEAILMYDEAIKLNPLHSDSYYNKGISLNKIKDMKKLYKCMNKPYN